MSAVVEVHIGTEFGAKNSELSNLDLTARTADIAKAIMTFCNYSVRVDKDSPYFLISRRYALDDCANLIVHLMQIHMNMCKEQPRLPSTFPVDLEHHNLDNLAENSWPLWSHVWGIRAATCSLNDGNARQETVQKEIEDAIYQVCVIVAKLGETDLEPFITEHLSMHS